MTAGSRPRSRLLVSILAAGVSAMLVGAGVVNAPAARGQVPPAGAGEPADHVDPFIGTLGSGFVFPGPSAPFGMVQLSPDTEGYFAYTGYLYSDSFIRGFSHVHVAGMGVPSAGNVPLMPIAGPVVSTDARRYQVPFSHAAEEAEPGYYRVRLGNGVLAELTAGERLGVHRYTFPPGVGKHVLIDAGRHIPGNDTESPHRIPGAYPAALRMHDPRTVVGTANPTRDGPQHYAVHFAVQFNRRIQALGVWERRGDPVRWGRTSVAGTGAGAAVRFGRSASREVVARVAISFVDQPGALANLKAGLAAGAGFARVRERTRDAWNEALRAIDVSGGTVGDRTSFYTALYHVLQHPNLFSDKDGRYLGYDGKVHRIGDPGDPMPAGSEYYANFSFWDTYRGQVQLLALVAPDRFRDMMRSLEAIRKWGGRLPRWGLMNRYADFMNGEPALQVLADAYCRGLVPDDVLQPLYEDAVRLALRDHRDPSYLKYGYVPYDVSESGASSTLEHALGDFALALVANRLGRTAERAALLRRAGSWRNVLDPQTGFVRPRHSDGSWRTPFRPELPDGYREGTGWQYTWLVPHDVAGLFAGIGAGRGGMKAVERRLDRFFSTPLTENVPAVTPEVQQKITLFGIAYAGDQYAPSNEHDLHAPYLYAWTPSPWKTQGLVRAYQWLYRPTPDGLPGNDDLGTMSAWYVWSALGFYPAIAGSPVYVVGSPVFPRARIRLEGGGTFTIDAPGASRAGKYVQSATLDGATFSRAWFTHRSIADGGELTLDMGPTANTAWATGPSATPPSQSTRNLSAFGCSPG